VGARLCRVANARRSCRRSHRPRATFGSRATWERPNRRGVSSAHRCLQGRPERPGRHPGRRRSDRALGDPQPDPSCWDSTHARAPRGSSGGTRLRDAPTAWPHSRETRPASIKRGCVAIQLPHRSCARATPDGRVGSATVPVAEMRRSTRLTEPACGALQGPSFQGGVERLGQGVVGSCRSCPSTGSRRAAGRAWRSPWRCTAPAAARSCSSPGASGTATTESDQAVGGAAARSLRSRSGLADVVPRRHGGGNGLGTNSLPPLLVPEGPQIIAQCPA